MPATPRPRHRTDLARIAEASIQKAPLRLGRPRYPESVFRGIVPRAEKFALGDLWQMALDAVAWDSRGAEQAEYILGRVLKLQEEA